MIGERFLVFGPLRHKDPQGGSEQIWGHFGYVKNQRTRKQLHESGEQTIRDKDIVHHIPRPNQ